MSTFKSQPKSWLDNQTQQKQADSQFPEGQFDVPSRSRSSTGHPQGSGVGLRFTGQPRASLPGHALIGQADPCLRPCVALPAL